MIFKEKLWFAMSYLGFTNFSNFVHFLTVSDDHHLGCIHFQAQVTAESNSLVQMIKSHDGSWMKWFISIYLIFDELRSFETEKSTKHLNDWMK